MDYLILFKINHNIYTKYYIKFIFYIIDLKIFLICILLKKIFKIININECELVHIIEWNNKYIIVADYYNKSFKIIDIEENKMICDINGQHTDKLVSIKKIYHPLYGESLLSAADDNIIKLWII